MFTEIVKIITIEQMKKDISCTQAAMNLLARREHSRLELALKLKLRKHSNKEIEETLNDLKNRNLQSNKRFTECYITARAAKGFGPLKIKYELEEKGIDKSLIDEIIDMNSGDWIEYLSKAYHKKFGDPLLSIKMEEKNKQINYLIYKGFSLNQIKFFFKKISDVTLKPF